MLKRLLACTVTIAVCGNMYGQGNASGIDHSYKPMVVKLDEKGQKFIRFITWHQVWLTHTMNNPGTLDINGEVQQSSTDIAIRRSRVLIHSQISPRFIILTHFGINNQSFVNGGSTAVNNYNNISTVASNGGKRPQLYIHDAYTEFAVKPVKLHLGAGIHYWNGVSRFSSHSTLNFMTADAPIFNWYNIEATDQFARQLGIYAKGQIGRIDYRMHVNKPFAFGTAKSSIVSPNAVNVLNEHWSTGGYVNYMFFDKENNTLPYFVGSYLGAKKVFNIGAGWYHHIGATAFKASETSAVKEHGQSNFGIDLFYDVPLNKKKRTAFSLYSVFYKYDFGPGYLRNIGILNHHAAVQSISTNPAVSWAGGGNMQPTIGTGEIWYTQAGYLLPAFNNGTAFMPYATFTYKNFERIGKSSAQYDLGLNYLINQHHAKISVQYSNRPVYRSINDQPVRNGSKSEYILQTQIFL